MCSHCYGCVLLVASYWARRTGYIDRLNAERDNSFPPIIYRFSLGDGPLTRGNGDWPLNSAVLDPESVLRG
jgi:hypothetical protein